MSEKIHLTKEGLAELQTEYENLLHVVRPNVIEALKAARALGDLSENADYDAARDEQAKVEARISVLDNILSNYELIDEKKTSKLVQIGSLVTLLDLETKIESTYTIVGSIESDPLNGKLSNVTPLAIAIMGKKAGSKCEVEVANPYKVEIISIK